MSTFHLTQPPEVDKAVAGRVRVEPKTMQKHLGSTAWIVWLCLIWHRDGAGITFITRDVIAAKRGLSFHQVARALVKLRKLHLVETLSTWRRNRKKRSRLAKIYSRRVYGDYRGGVLTLPNVAARALKTSSLHGGQRVGAGRPIGTKGGLIVKKTRDEVSRTCGSIQSATRKIKAPHKLQFKAPRYVRSIYILDAPSSSLSEKKTRASRRARVRGSTKPIPLLERKGPFTLGTRPADRDFHFEPIRLPLRGTFDSDGAPLTPPYPSTDLFPVARTRSPPPFPKEPSSKTKRDWLLRAYAGAAEARSMFGYRKVSDPKALARLEAAADALIEHNLPVGSWALWSFDLWLDPTVSADDLETKRPARSKPPPLAWVWNATRIHRRRGWFRACLASYEGGRSFFAEAHREYARLYKTVAGRLKRMNVLTATEDEVRAVVQSVFPDGWEHFIDETERQTAETQEALDNLIARFDYKYL